MEWNSYNIVVHEDRAKDLKPGDHVPLELLVRDIARLAPKKPTLQHRVREWWHDLLKTVFSKWMRRRQQRIEAKARQVMSDRIANAWKNDADE